MASIAVKASLNLVGLHQLGVGVFYVEALDREHLLSLLANIDAEIHRALEKAEECRTCPRLGMSAACPRHAGQIARYLGPDSHTPTKE